MLRRCYNPTYPSYRFYGARGVTVCAIWRASFDAFIAVPPVGIGPRPSLAHRLSRREDLGDYGPDNCEWKIFNYKGGRDVRDSHGSVSEYVRGCRCAACRNARLQYDRARPKRKKAPQLSLRGLS